MTQKTIIRLSLLGLLTILLIVIGTSFISFSNTEVTLRTQFEQKQQERVAFYDKMYKVLAQKSQIAVKNDESFRQNVNTFMEGRKDSENVMFKWIQEANPNANYAEVSALYKDLSRAVEAQRDGFFNQEKVLQDIVRQHTNHLKTFPNTIYNSFFGRDLLEYSPIKSTLTEKVFETGKDDEIKLDL